MEQEQTESVASHIGSLFANYQMAQPRKCRSERAELIQYFYNRAQASWQGKSPLKPSYVAYRLSHLTVHDLWAFKSMCEDRERTGYPWSKYFWGALKTIGV